MIRICVFLFLFSSLNWSLFCSESPKNSFFQAVTGESKVPEPDQIMGTIIDKTVQEISKKYGYLPVGIGMEGKFKGIGISFQSYKSLEKDNARGILFECAELLLKNINSCAEIQEYLEIKPFTLDNIGITIYSADEKNCSFPHPKLAVANIGDGKLTYRTEEPGNRYGYKEVTRETLEQARAILNKTAQ